MSFGVPDNPLWILAALALPPLLLVLPWRAGWVATLAVLAWGDSSMPGADLPRHIQVRAAMLGLLFVQGIVRLRGRGQGTPPPLAVSALASVALASTLWSETPLASATSALAFVALLAVAYAHAARYGSGASLATATVERAVLVLCALVAIGLVPRLHGGEDLSIAGRLRGFFSNPNGLGITCALVAPWVALRAMRSTGPARGAAVVGLALLAGVAFLSGSRTGLGGLVVGTATTFFLRHPSRSLVVVLLAGVGIATATLASGGDVDLEEGAVGTLTRPQNLGRLSGRLDRWNEGLERFRERPWLGGGFKSSWRFGTESDELSGAITATGTNYHSQPVETLVDLGVVGAALYVLVVVGTMRSAWTLASRRTDPVAAGAGAAFAGTFAASTLDSFFHNWLFTPASPYAFLFWSLAALCVRLERQTRAAPAPAGSAPAPLARPAASLA